MTEQVPTPATTDEASSLPTPMQPDLEAQREDRKSKVRVRVTYAAAVFLFGGGAIFIAFLIWTGRRADAIALFNTILPVSAAIISFWFAGRARGNPEKRNQGNPGGGEDPNNDGRRL